MKLILIPLVLVFSCNKKEQAYITGSWVCEDFDRYKRGVQVENCINIMTGKREEVIYNPTFVIPVKKNETK